MKPSFYFRNRYIFQFYLLLSFYFHLQTVFWLFHHLPINIFEHWWMPELLRLLVNFGTILHSKTWARYQSLVTLSRRSWVYMYVFYINIELGVLFSWIHFISIWGCLIGLLDRYNMICILSYLLFLLMVYFNYGTLNL